MKSQPKPGFKSNDDIQTPPELCWRLVQHFRPYGTVLEPCRGDGNFYDAIADYSRTLTVPIKLDYCEIKEGRNFYEYSGRTEWILTNPPWGQLREPRGKDTHPMSFLRKSLMVANNVIFIATLNHLLGSKARYKMLDELGFGIREFILLDNPPPPWPQGGFQLGAVYFQFHYRGPIQLTDWRAFDKTPTQGG